MGVTGNDKCLRISLRPYGCHSFTLFQLIYKKAGTVHELDTDQNNRARGFQDAL